MKLENLKNLRKGHIVICKSLANDVLYEGTVTSIRSCSSCSDKIKGKCIGAIKIKGNNGKFLNKIITICGVEGGPFIDPIMNFISKEEMEI